MQTPVDTAELQTWLGERCGSGEADPLPFFLLKELVVSNKPQPLHSLRATVSGADLSVVLTMRDLESKGYVASGIEDGTVYYAPSALGEQMWKNVARLDASKKRRKRRRS